MFIKYVWNCTRRWYTFIFSNEYELDISTAISVCDKQNRSTEGCSKLKKFVWQIMPSGAKNLHAKSVFWFHTSHFKLAVVETKSKYWLCREVFRAGRYYLSQSDIEVAISSPYALKNKGLPTHPVQFYPVQVSHILCERRNRNDVGSLWPSPFR